MDIRENFASLPDGIVTTHSNLPKTGPGTPWVRNGFLTVKDPNTFEGGSYHLVEFDSDVTVLGAKFVLTPSSAGGGLFAMSIQGGDITLTSPAVPTAPVHLYLEAGYWNLDVNGVAGTPVNPLINRPFKQPLKADGVHLYSIEARLDRARRELELDLPDGTTVLLTHELFALPSRFAYVEPFKVPGNPSAKANALIREWWASTA